MVQPAARFSPARLRKSILGAALAGDSGHIACAFSLVEILSVLYSKFIRFPADRPDDPDRDIFVLSKGHGVMALYACLLERGFLSQEALDRYFSDGSLLHGFCQSNIP